MAINKNFVVKNGLEVATPLIIANSDLDVIGIGTTNIKHTFHVNGGVGCTNLVNTGILTTANLELSGYFKTSGSTGLSGQYLVSTGTGVEWKSIPQIRTVTEQVAGVAATGFNVSYNPGLIDVYVNGVRLSPNEFEAIDGSLVTLSSPCFGGESVEFITYGVSSIGVGFTGILGVTVKNEGVTTGTALNINSLNFVGDNIEAEGVGFGVTIYSSSLLKSNTTGIHTLSNIGIGTTTASSKLTVSGDCYVTGVITSGYFNGDGSRLLNVNQNWKSTSIGIHTLSSVGIGTTNPEQPLHVDGNSLFDSYVAIGTAIDTSYFLKVDGSTSFVNGISFVDRLYVSGISSFVSNTDIIGSLNVSGISTLSELYVTGISSISTLNVGYGGTIITSTNTGLVGINSTSPQNTLDIIGDVKVGINTSQGIILTSPSGNKYRLIVDDGGNLTTTAV